LSTDPTLPAIDDTMSMRPAVKRTVVKAGGLKARLAANLEKLMERRADGMLWVKIDDNYSVKWDGNCFILFETRRVKTDDVSVEETHAEDDAEARVTGYRGRGYFGSLPDALRKYVTLNVANGGALAVEQLGMDLARVESAIKSLEAKLCQ